MTFDAHEIAPGLWMGSRPARGWDLALAGFRVLCLCAWEHQSPCRDFPGVDVARIDLDDDGTAPPDGQLEEAWRLAAYLAGQVRAGRPALVTCRQGRNRSGLLVAMTLCHLTGCGGEAAAQAVKERRHSPFGPALTSGAFLRVLGAIAPKSAPGPVTRQAALAAGLEASS